MPSGTVLFWGLLVKSHVRLYLLDNRKRAFVAFWDNTQSFFPPHSSLTSSPFWFYFHSFPLCYRSNFLCLSSFYWNTVQLGRGQRLSLGVIFTSPSSFSSWLFHSVITTLLFGGWSAVITNPLEPKGGEGSPQFCSPAPLCFLLWLCVFQRGVCVHQETCMPRLVRRSCRCVTVPSSCFFSSSSAETCSLSWFSDWTRASTWLSRLLTRAWDTWWDRTKLKLKRIKGTEIITGV